MWYGALLVSLLILFEIAGIFIAAIGFPGPLFASSCCLVYYFLSPEPIFAWWHLLIFFGISIFSEIFDVISAGWGAKKFGKASTLAGVSSIFCGLLFALLGTAFIPIPIIGTVAGALLGSFLGAFAVEAVKDRKKGLSVGFASMITRLFAMILKIAFAVFILAFTIIAWIF